MEPDEFVTVTRGAALFGRILVRYREQLGLTQEALADRSGLSARSVRALESRRRVPRKSTVTMLADALGLQGAEREAFCRSAYGQEDANPTRTEEPPADTPPARRHPVERAIRPTTGSCRPPAQLPRPLATFVGRDAELRQLTALMQAADGGAPASAVAVVCGPAGVGKTALAAHWAHRVAHHFPDGQLYVDLRGFDAGGPAVAPAEVLRGFLEALGVPRARVPAEAPAQGAAYRSLLAGRRVLVVLDNACDADQIRPLLPGAPECAVVITSRSTLTGLAVTHSAVSIRLGPLGPAEAAQLLERRLAPGQVTGHPTAMESVLTTCAGLPLALAIVGARAAVSTGGLSAVAAQLAAEGLDVLDAGDSATNLRVVLWWSYRALSPAAAELFRLLALHPGPDIAPSAAASLVGRPIADVRRSLDELIGLNLVGEDRDRRVSLHDLVRAYAAEQMRAASSEDDRRTATIRLLSHYLHTAERASHLRYANRSPIPLPDQPPGVVVAPLPDRQHAQDWFAAEHAVVVSLVRRAAEPPFHPYAWRLAWTLWDYFFDAPGHWYEWAAIQRVALEAGRVSAEPVALAHAHRGLGLAASQLGKLDEADRALRAAIDHYAAIGDHRGQANTHRNLARVLIRQSRPQAALDHASAAVRLATACGDRNGEAAALNQAGWYHAHLGSYERATVACRRALELHRQIGNRDGQAATLDSLGFIHHQLADHREAIVCYRAAIALYEELGDGYEHAVTLDHLADTYHAAGRFQQALETWSLAADLLSRLNHPGADDVLAKLTKERVMPR